MQLFRARQLSAGAFAVIILLCTFLPLFGQSLYVLNSQSRTLSRIDLNSDQVENSFAMLGNVPNKLVVGEEHLWVINSGDNAVQKLSRESGASLSQILVAPGSNPWDGVLDGTDLYVSGLFSGKVYRIDTLSGSVTGSLSVGTAPEGMLVIGNRLYVANAGNYAANYAGSSVAVVDLESFSLITTIPVSANPQYLAEVNGKVHVSCTGNWTDISGKICIIDCASNSVSETIEIGGTPGCLFMRGEELALVGDSSGEYLYSYDPLSYELYHGAADPIPNGGSEIVGTDTFLAVLRPNWSANGTVRILHPDLSPWKEYTVAMMPTDMKLGFAATSSDDQVAVPAVLNAYPNPVACGSTLSFDRGAKGMDEIRLYNLRGQEIARTSRGKDSIAIPQDLPQGVYFYRSGSYSGKVLVSD